MRPCTTGVQTAQVAIDWLQLTYPPETQVEAVQQCFGGPVNWLPLSRGMYGYRQGCRRGNVWVLWEGRSDMGVHVQVSGGGCRQLASEGVVDDWPAFLGGLLKQEVRFTRVDVALDDRAGLLSVDAVRRCVEEGLVVCRWQKAGKLEDQKLVRPEVSGKSVQFGTKNSDVRIHVYDKALEQGVSGPWVRVELQARRQRAQALATAVAERGASAVPGIVRGYLDFKRRGRHPQRERWPSQVWWATFLGDCEKARLTVSRPSSPESEFRWLFQCAAPRVALLEEQFGPEGLQALLAHGRERNRARGRVALQTSAHGAGFGSGQKLLRRSDD